MDDPVFKQKYQKYKMRVKLWEKDFKNKHGRVPSKYDIRDASQEIRDSYKMYYKLKTSFLEDTLNDVLTEDGFDLMEMSQASTGDTTLDGSLCESINGGPQLPLDISGIVNSVASSTSTAFSNLHELSQPSALSNLANLHENHVLKSFEAVEESKLNDNAWGKKVSKKLATETAESNKDKKPFKSNLNQKLFKAASFSMRNPRKSLSRTTLDGSLRGGTVQHSLNDSLGMTREVLPDLETILTQKAKDQQAANAAIASNTLLASDKTKESLKPLKTQVDEGWLKRNEAQNDIKTAPISNRKTELDNRVKTTTPAQKPTYGLSNLDMSKIIPHKIETEMDNKNSDIVELATKMPEIEPQIENNFVEMLEEKEKSRKPTRKVATSDSSDSVVSDSEGEDKPQAYRHIVKRRRVLTTVVDKTQGNVNETEDFNTNSNIKHNIKSLETIEESNSALTNPLDDEDKDKDFSADEDKDADYVLEKPAKGQRKKAIAKRAAKPLVKKEKKPPPTPKEKKEKKPRVTKSTKVAEENARKPNTRRARKTNDSEGLDNEEDEPEEKPLNPEDLKYAMALERSDITCMPRVKLSELESADDVAQRYINTIGSLATIAPKRSIPVVNEKRDEARKKLEGKIASGKLNENFVRINIQKKTFVRGKKSVNFSKYKKKQWKHQKHIAALSGPDMNMGGCDGGVLTCFTCGQVGHFAQNCKIKGDGLLPLSAQLAEDPSPFPTLEEAEQMASQSALAVHSRNITKMPQASNAAMLHGGAGDGTTEVEEQKEAHEIGVESSEDDDEDNDEDDVAYNEMLIETDDELEGMDLDGAVSMETVDAPVVSPIKQYVGHQIPEEFLKKAGLDAETGVNSKQFSGVGAMYDLNADGTVQDVTPEVLEALRLFGHTNFRKGQDRAIMRILSGLSTLVTLSTGSGKSLCYQLPAYLYSRQKKSITLVISPLVSLMEDQVTGVPNFLRAQCLHTNQTPQQRIKILQLISDGELDILLVSPEAVVAGERSTGFGSILRQLPPIAFACIDEAHCVSQWSHNFRPSYLMICKVLKKNLGVHTVLGLTATATLPTRLSIINHLGITDGERGIISDIPLPDNLVLSVSKDENRDAALMKLLNSKRFDACQSIIIYCTRRDECERVAGFIRTCMQDRKVPEKETDGGKKKRKRVNWHAEPYHAGMPSSRRRTIQNAFMKNELRIVVATIAFGMGINKPDIRAVLHYNMPRNFESYVQEVGRAGRDSKPSHCHLFLDANGGDQNELRRHIYANSIDRHVIRKLLQRIFVSCSCDKNLKDSSSRSKISQDRQAEKLEMDASDFGSTASGAIARQHICPGHEVGFSIEKTVEALDIPEENIATLLCYMELDSRWGINILSSAYINAKVISYGGPKYLKHAAKECPPLAMAIALEIKSKTFKEDSNIIEFSAVDIAAAIGWNSGVVKYQLKNLEWTQVNGYPKRTPISVTFSDLGLRIKAPGDFTAEEIDDALDTLYNRSVKQEKTQLIQLQYVFQGLSSVAYNSCVPCTSDNFAHDRSDQLKAIIRDYFRNDYPKDLKLEIDTISVPDDHINCDVHGLLNMYPDNNFSGRNVARIFYGISSPNYPAVMWGRCKYWRAHSKTDFNRIVQLANAIIVQQRI